MASSSERSAFRPAALAAGLALILPALSQARDFRIHRKDGVETVRVTEPSGHYAEFLCRRGGPRPGTGHARIAFKVDRAFPFPTPQGKQVLKVASKATSLEIALPIAVERDSRPSDLPEARGGRGRPAARQPTADYVVVTLDQPGKEWQASIMSAITNIFDASRSRRAIQVTAEVKALGLFARFQVSPANNVTGFAKGCLDGIPEPDDDVQGGWHQGVSSSDGEKIVTLTASSNRGADGVARQVKLILACDHGDYSLRLATPGQVIEKAFASILKTAIGERKLAFAAGPAPEEATAEREDAKAALKLLHDVEEAELSGVPTNAPEGRVTFDVYGLSFAARKMRTLCKGI